jgi:hypothetical protein
MGNAKQPLDPAERQLWKLAKQRAEVKRNLTLYVVVNTILIVLWLKQQGFPLRFDNFWPGWVLFGWGIALIFSFRKAYGEDRTEMTRREYERLKQDQT